MSIDEMVVRRNTKNLIILNIIFKDDLTKGEKQKRNEKK